MIDLKHLLCVNEFHSLEQLDFSFRDISWNCDKTCLYWMTVEMIKTHLSPRASLTPLTSKINRNISLKSSESTTSPFRSNLHCFILYRDLRAASSESFLLQNVSEDSLQEEPHTFCFSLSWDHVGPSWELDQTLQTLLKTRPSWRPDPPEDQTPDQIIPKTRTQTRCNLDDLDVYFTECCFSLEKADDCFKPNKIKEEPSSSASRALWKKIVVSWLF